MTSTLTKIINDTVTSPIPGVITHSAYKSFARPSSWKEKLELVGYSLLFGGSIDGITTIPYFFADQALQGDESSQFFLYLALGYRAISNVVINYVGGMRIGTKKEE